MRKAKALLLVLACYLLALLVWLGVCGAALLLDSRHQRAGQMPTLQLGVEDFTHENVLVLEDAGGTQRFVTTNDDPNLVYVPEGVLYVREVVFSAESHVPGGEITLYYETRAGAGFNERDKVWATRGADGSWRFDLGGRAVTALRLDPGTVERGVIWTVDRIVLNEAVPAWRYFVPDALGVFLLLALPALAGALFFEVGRPLYWRLKQRNRKGGASA